MSRQNRRLKGAFGAVVMSFVLIAAACSEKTPTAGDFADPTSAPPASTAASTAPADTAPDTAPPATELAPGADLVALGEELYQKTAGGIGCQACHGPEGLGDVGPNILGKSADTIKGQLETNDSMSFIILSDEEIQAVAAYLKVLEDQAGG